MTVVLQADAGELTVARRVAAYVYGTWGVQIPDGVEQQEQDYVDGYLYRPDDAPRGRFDLAMVRSDATVDMKEQRSNAELVMDEASSRVEGRAFFERDISTGGLGRYTPGVDVHTGDIVDVQLWGRRIALPVTAIDMTTGADGPTGWRVHVGGQLIEDTKALGLQNAAVRDAQAAEAKRMQERAEKAVAAATSAAAAADTARDEAVAAKADAEAAASAAEQLRNEYTAATSTVSTAVDDAETAQQRAEAAAALADTKTAEAIQANTAAGRARQQAIAAVQESLRIQGEINQAHDEVDELHSDMITKLDAAKDRHEAALSDLRLATTALTTATIMASEAREDIKANMSRFLVCESNRKTWNSYLEVVNGSWTTVSKVRAKGSWTGHITHEVTYTNRGPAKKHKRITATDRQLDFGGGLGASIDFSVTHYVIDKPGDPAESREADQNTDG